jgi:uncharacterized membrane-anchored protein YjiN (DUF445 family)
MSKGTLSILISLAVLAGGLVLLGLGVPSLGAPLLYLGGSATVGAVTNRIAIRAIFTPWPGRRLALPGTGLVERNREKIIQALAEAVAVDLITPETLSAWLKQTDFFEKLRNHASRHVRELSQDPRRRAKWRERVRQSLNRRISEALNSSQAYQGVRDFFTRMAGPLGKLGHLTGLTDYDSVSYKILDGVRGRVTEKMNARDGWFDEQFSAILLEAADDLDHWDVAASDEVTNMIRYVVGEVDVESIVKHSLSRFSAEEVRKLVEDLSKEHLALLEVWGAVLGAAAGGAIWAASRLLGLL